MSNMNLAQTAGACVLAFGLAGCATVGNTGDPCKDIGATIIPHSPYNAGMTEAGAGLARGRNDFGRLGGYYNGYNIVQPRYNPNFINQNKPSELVYTFTTVNRVVQDIRVPNNASNTNQVWLGVIGALVGSRIGGAPLVGAALGGGAGFFGGRQLDQDQYNQGADRISACVNKVVGGAYDGINVTPLQPGQVLVPRQY